MKLYRSRSGVVLGVCRGLADWSGYPVRYFRIAAVAAAFFFFWWTAVAYLIGAILLPVKRPDEYEPEGFKENLDDLKDDARDFFHREYGDFRRAFFEKEKKGSPKDIVS